MGRYYQSRKGVRRGEESPPSSNCRRSLNSKGRAVPFVWSACPLIQAFFGWARGTRTLTPLTWKRILSLISLVRLCSVPSVAADNFRHSCQAVPAIVHRSLPCWLSIWLSRLKRTVASDEQTRNWLHTVQRRSFAVGTRGFMGVSAAPSFTCVHFKLLALA